MAKEKEAIIKRKEEALAHFNDYLNACINCDDEKQNKKASLLSYWIKDYISYLKNEDDFNPRKLIKYKRGDIIKVNLGFNIGNEEGGLHYAVVVDNNNALNSSIITVIPLTSYKKNAKINSNYDVYIGNELYTKLHTKILSELSGLEKYIQKINKELKEVSSTSFFSTDNDINRQMNQCKKILKEISRMKEGSIALVGQITTISKMRIYDPKNSSNVLSNIRLSNENLDKINDMIKKLYLFK